MLSKAIVFSQEREIERLEKRKNDIQVEPALIVKNGKVVNQKQIDNWKSMTPEMLKQMLDEINGKVAELRREETRLLEKGAITFSDIIDACANDKAKSESHGE